MITSVELAGAFSFGSPLSIEYVLEALVPELALAVDGDPATVVPSALDIGTVGDAAARDQRRHRRRSSRSGVHRGLRLDRGVRRQGAHLEDADALKATVEAYTTAGSAMGGISLVPTATVVDGDTATITYDVLFGTASAYTDQTGTITKIGDVWVVSKTDFCSFMASARNACPA